MDGYVVIGTELDTKSFDSQIKETEAKLKILEKSADESDIPKQFRRSAEETRQLNAEIEKTKNKLISLNQQQAKIDVKDLDSVKFKLGNIGDSTESVIQKIGKWALAVFSVRSAYGFVRNSASILSQYNQQLATDISYIQYALATTLQPVIERIIQLVYKLLAYVNYIAKAWFNVNLFGNSSAEAFKKAQKSTSKIKKDTKEIAKNLATSIDEITNLDISSDTDSGVLDDIVTPSYDLSGMKDIEIPKWVKWIADNGDTIKKILKGIGVAVAGIKIAKLLKDLDKLGGILGTLGTIGVIAIGVSLLYTALTGRELIGDIKDIIKGLTDLKEINNEQQKQSEKNSESTSNLISKFQELDKTVGLTSEQQKRYIDYLLNGVESNGSLIRSLENQKTWLGEVTGANNILTESQKNYKKSIDEQLEALKILYEQDKLNEDQKKRYKKLLEIQIENLALETQNLGKNTNEYRKNKEEIKNLKGQLENLTGKEYKIKTSLEKPKTNAFKSTLNDLIGATEELFDSIKGGFTHKYNTVKFPRLASGGIVNKPGTGINMGSYIAGERGAEAILPLQNSKFVSDFANQVASKMGNDINTDLLLELNRNITELANRPINFYINGKDCAQALYSDLKNEEKRLNISNSIILK